MPCKVRYCKSLRSLLEEELDTDISSNEELDEALDQYDRLTETLASITAKSLTILQEVTSTQISRTYRRWIPALTSLSA